MSFGGKGYVSTAGSKSTNTGVSIITNKTEDSDLLKNLYNKIYYSINTVLENFISGDIKDDLYSQTNLTSISQTILGLRTKNNKYYNGILNIISDNLTSLKRGYNYYLDRNMYLESLEACDEKMQILNDFNKLKDYLLKLYQELILFNTESSLNTSASVKKEYYIYINLYGIPNDLVFEEDKMTEIVYLINLGVF